MRVMNFEPTPNPNAMKFNLDGTLVSGGSLSFDSPEAAAADPLASALFQTGKVASVFFMPSFLTVTKVEEAAWGVVAPIVARTIETAAAAAGQRRAEPGENPDAPEASGMLAAINGVIDRQIRPALAGDGGGLEVLSLEDKTLTIRYQGACGSCPSSIAGTLAAIQNLLQAEVDEALTVSAA